MQAQEPNTLQPECVLVCPCGAELGLNLNRDESAAQCPRCGQSIASPARPCVGLYRGTYDPFRESCPFLPLLPKQRKFALVTFVFLGVALSMALFQTGTPGKLLDCGLFALGGALGAFTIALPALGLSRFVARVVHGCRDQSVLHPIGPGVAVAVAWSVWSFFLLSQFGGMLIGYATGIALLVHGYSLGGAGLAAMLAAAISLALFCMPRWFKEDMTVATSFTTFVLPYFAAPCMLFLLPSLRPTGWLVNPLVALLATLLIYELRYWGRATTTKHITGIALGLPAAFAWLAVTSHMDFARVQLEELATLRGHSGNVCSVVFNADGTLLASGSEDASIKLWDVATMEELATLKGHLDVVRSVVFSPDEKTLASASQDQTIKLWDIDRRAEKATLRGHEAFVMSLTISPDGRTLASASGDDTIKLWDLNTHQVKRTLRGHASAVWSVAFSPDGKTLASGSGDATIKLWDADSGKVTKTLRGHTKAVRSVAFHPDNKTLASASWDETIKLWDIEMGEETRTFRGPEELAVTFSPDGKFVAGCGLLDSAAVWSVETGKELASPIHRGSWPAPGITWILTLAYSPDGTILATGSVDKTVKLWDMTAVK